MENINLQMYSFGHDCPLSAVEKIKKAGEMGYAGVEFAREYDGVPVEEIKKALEEAGVKAVSAHVGFDKMAEDLPYLAQLGVKFVACPMTSFCDAEEAKEVAQELNKWGAEAKKYGIIIGYHNHTQEFNKDQDKYLYDWVIENTDPETVAFEIDCGWASAAGIDPVEYIKAHAGRIAAIHMKENGAVIGPDPAPSRKNPPEWPKFELDENGKPIFPPEFIEKMKERDKLNVPTGSGIVDWKAIKAAADAQREGVIYVVEREANYGDKDRISCLKEDVAWLKANV
ncbi:sugar phosphate isomerase/epimerase family protein [Acutalibacter sp.]|uniref:sugar phosphate isomerase/epimerase family protein n=1 Tax=Acutalibacter sp. TaxID=1918636 RepID=UPI0021706CAE|nr:TIM barrel protein [Acutalibacter sp.]